MALPTAATTGFSGAPKYDTYRPSYNPSLTAEFISRLVPNDSSTSSPSSPLSLLDLAAGTGLFTAHLPHLLPPSTTLYALEPHPSMRSVLASKPLPNLKILPGSATEIPLPDAALDVVTIAQAFHWFANPEALREIARVLKKGGDVGLVWNVEDYNQVREFGGYRTEWEREWGRLNWEFSEDGCRRFKNEEWRGVWEMDGREEVKEGGGRLFGELEVEERREEVWLSEEHLWERFATLSNIANQTEEVRGEIRKRFEGILRDGETRGEVVRDGSGRVRIWSTFVMAWAERV